MEARQAVEQQETLNRLRREVAELRASRERLVLAADAERRSIERDLHDGVQQHLVALAVDLQLASTLVETDPVAAKARLEGMRRDLEHALDEAARLAQRIYPTLNAHGFAAALRAAVPNVRVATRVDLPRGATYAPEIVGTVYSCIRDLLEAAGAGARATVTLREGEGTLSFECVVDGDVAESLEGLRDRVHALGGRLTSNSEPGGAVRVAGSLPLSR